MSNQGVDALGRSVVVGDSVLFIRPNFNHLVTGTVAKITPRGVTITHGRDAMINRNSKQFAKIGA